MIAEAPEAAFFVAGGTLSPSATSYVERAADRAIYEALLAGRFCYVLNSRQMGKSSLCVRTMARLDKAGMNVAFVDLTRIGGRSVTPERWYAGIAIEIALSLNLSAETLAYWKENGHIGPLQRLFGVLREVILARLEGPLAIFIDEIDLTRSLPFSADEFFAAIRECFNRRVQDSVYARLTFCLLGVAVPSDLINNATATPFNIGERIYLRDFTLEEARGLAGGFVGRPNGEGLLERVFHWTNGHPYLTQSLCGAIAGDSSATTSHDVDALVRRDLLEPSARETNINLADVANRALHSGDLEADPEKFRADLLAAYERAWKGKPLADDESNRVAALLKLSGMMRTDGKNLHVRNLIYHRVFGRAWIRENMPGQEVRRQRLAVRVGVLRTGALSLLVIGTISVLAWNNRQMASEMELERNFARYDAYAATMRHMNDLWDEHNLAGIQRSLDRFADSPYRGWEYAFWHRLPNRSVRTIDQGQVSAGFFFPDLAGKYGISNNASNDLIQDLASGRTLHALPSWSRWYCWLRDSRRFVGFGWDDTLRLIDAESGRVLATRLHAHVDLGFYDGKYAVLPGDRELVTTADDGGLIGFDLPTLVPHRILLDRPVKIGGSEQISRDGRIAVWSTMAHPFGSSLVIGNPQTGHVTRTVDLGEGIHTLDLDPSARRAAIGTLSGRLYFVDLASGKISAPTRWSGDEIMRVSFSDDGTRLMVATRYRESILLDVTRAIPVEVRRFAESDDAGFLPGGRQSYTAYSNVRIYNLADGPDIPEVRLAPGAYTGLICPDGDLISQRGAEPCRLTPLLRSAPASASLPDVQWAGADGSVYLRKRPEGFEARAPSGKVLRDIPAPAAAVGFSSPDACYISLSANRGEELTVYSLGSQSAPRRLHLPGPYMKGAFNSDGSLFAVSTAPHAVSLYRTSDLAQVWFDDRPRDDMTQFAFSADGKRLAGSGNDDCAEVWDVASGRRLLELVGHSQSVTCITWSPDGKRLATGSDDLTVRLWDAETGTELGKVGRHSATIIAVRFLSGGHTLASFSRDGVAKLWMTGRRQ